MIMAVQDYVPPGRRSNALGLARGVFKEAKRLAAACQIPLVRVRRPGKQNVLAHGRCLDKSSLADPHNLGTGLDRIIYMFQHMRAVNEVEELILEWETMKIGSDQWPAVLKQNSVAMSGWVKVAIDQMWRPRKRISAAADIEHPLARLDLKIN